MWKLWRRRRPIAGTVCWAFTEAKELLKSPQPAKTMAAAITEQQFNAIQALVAKRRRKPVTLQFYVELVDRHEQLIRESDTNPDGIRRSGE